MTRKNFYRKLRKVADQFKWKINKDGCLRGRKGKNTYCPITAVVKIYNGVEYQTHDFDKAGYYLGFDSSECEDIVRAADYDKKHLGSKYKRIRDALVRAVKDE